MAQVVGDNYKRKGPTPKPKSRPKSPLASGGFLQDEMNVFESERMARQGTPVGGLPLATGGLSVNLERIAREIAADQKKSKENSKGRNKALKAAGNSLRWLIDQLSRTGNAVSTGLLYEDRETKKRGDTGLINPLPGIGAFLEGAKEGFLLKERSNFKEVLNEGGYTGRGAGTVGLIGDLTLDPLNLPLGIIAAPVKGGNAARKALQTREGARELGQAHRAGVETRSGVTGPADIRLTPDSAESYSITQNLSAGQTPSEVLAEGAAVAKRMKKSKKSKADQHIDNLTAQMDAVDDPAKLADIPAPKTTAAASALAKVSERLLSKTDVRIEPLRSADEAARLRPIVEDLTPGAVGKGKTNLPDAVPLDEMPDDIIQTIKYDARKRTDAWFDKMGRQSAEIKQTKSGPKAVKHLEGMSMAELRRQAAREKAAGEGATVIKLGSGKTGADVDISAAAHIKAIENSPEYQQALARNLKAAIAAHNKSLPKAKKEGSILQRTLEAIPAADEIVGKAATQVDEPVGIQIAKSEIARRQAVPGGGNTANLEKVVAESTPLAPTPVGVKAAAAAQGTYHLTPELERAVDAKIDNILEQITSGKVGSQKGHTFFSPMKQTNLYNSIRDALVTKMGYKKGKNRDELLADPEFRQFVREQYIRAEQIMIVRHGFHPTEWKRGVPGNVGARYQALSDFFAYVPVEDEMAGSSKFWTQIMNGEDGSGLAERLFAGQAIAEAPKVAHAIEEAVDTAVDAVDTLPEAAAMDVLDEAPKAAKDSVSDLSPSAQEVVQDNVKAAVQGITQSKGELFSVKYQQRAARVADDSGSARLGLREAEATDRVLGIGNIGNHSLLKINASAFRRAGQRLTPGLDRALSEAATKARASGERLTIRFNAGHGFDPFFHATRRGVANSAAARSQQHMGEISKVFRGMSHSDVKDVLNDVQMGKLDTPQAQAANEFLTKIFDAEDGWLVQNGITMKEFEEQLHRLYPTRHNAQGRVDTSWRPQVVEKPVDKLKQAKPDASWHDSWKYWNWTDNPAVDLLKVRLAFENSLAQRQMYEDLVHNFGISKTNKIAHAQARKEGWGEVKRFHPALDGYVFPPEIAQQINKHEDMFRMRKDTTSEFMKKYDKLLQGWKTGVTIYSPSHHIRNMVGDMWMAYFVDGVRSPVHYQQALRAVLHEKPDLDPAAFGTALTKTADKDVLFKMRNGTPVTAEQFRILWRDMGGHQAFASADNLDDLASVKGRIPTIIREKVASPIEDVTRMGHAIALMKRSKHTDPVKALEEIIPRVNRAHVDYGNLTDFERGTMRRLIPFYTWQRHVFPVLIDSMLRNPQRVMVYPKAQVAISEGRGFERDDTNYFPQSHQISPEWITAGAGVPYATNKRGNVIYGDPSNPFNDAIFKGLLLNPKSSIGGMLSPFVRVPAEMFVRNDPVLAPEGRQFFGGIPIKNRIEYLEDNTPILNNFIRLTRRDPYHGFDQREPTKDRPDEQGTNLTALINFLTAGGLQENTERRREFAEKNEGRK